MPSSRDSWSLYLGRYGSIVLRLHVTFPIAWLLILLVSAVDDSVPSSAALIGGLVLTLSAVFRELMRAASSIRVGGEPLVVVFAPLGNFSRYHLPADPPAHLVNASFGCTPHLILMVMGACCLAFYGDRNALRLLQYPLNPAVEFLAPQLVLIAQMVVWVNWCLLLVNLLPVEPLDGAATLRSVLWPMLGRNAAGMASTHFAQFLALVVALIAFVVKDSPLPASGVPYWFPLSVVSVLLLFSNNSWTAARRYDTGLAIDELDSDDEGWISNEWVESDDTTPVLVEHIQEKQEEALNRKRREREANEDERVDKILERLAETSFDDLPEEDRAILKKASRRYRKRRFESGES